MIKKLLPLIILMITINSYATGFYYLYIPFGDSFTVNNAQKYINNAFKFGIRLNNHSDRDILFDFYNFVRYRRLTRPANVFAILPQDINSIDARILNGVVFTLDPNASFYPLALTVSQAISTINDENDRTEMARRLLGEALIHIPFNQLSTNLVIGFPSVPPTAPEVRTQAIVGTTLFRNGVEGLLYRNPNYQPQAGASPVIPP